MIPEATHAARWSVMWKGQRGIVEKKFDHDFAGALDAYTLLKQHGKKLVTLRCCNAGFAPPRHITHHEDITYKVVWRKGKRYRKKVIEYRDLMGDHNGVGIWWCPYCIKLRPFKEVWQGRFKVFQCPICKITSTNFHVKKWNPMAKTIEFRRRRSARTRTRKR